MKKESISDLRKHLVQNGHLAAHSLKNGLRVGVYTHRKGMVQVAYDKKTIDLLCVAEGCRYAQSYEITAPTHRQVANRARKFLLKIVGQQEGRLH